MERNGEWLPWDEAVERAEQPEHPEPYPREWCELADEAREYASPFRKAPRFDIRGRPRDEA